MKNIIKIRHYETFNLARSFYKKIKTKKDNYLDNLSELLQQKLVYAPKEKDLILLRHKFIVENKDKTKDLITSTLIKTGIANGKGDSAMAITVSMPLAIGVKMLSEGKIRLRGVKRPTNKVIYEPILAELENHGIKLVEKRVRLKRRH
ncbi:saccharopine dehydrogenase C-terminal domain-containing protein [Candidatus Margulisiibacteriota bacterium]